MKESFLQAKIIQFCKESNITCFKIEQANTNGVPDLIVTVEGGVTAYIETKTTDTGKLSPIQKEVRDELLGKNALYFVIDTYIDALAVLYRMRHYYKLGAK